MKRKCFQIIDQMLNKKLLDIESHDPKTPLSYRNPLDIEVMIRPQVPETSERINTSLTEVW